MKAALIEAAATSDRALANDPKGGLVAYLRSVADDFPKVYTRVLARLIPHDLRIRAEVAQPKSAEDIKAQLRAKGIPVDRLFRLFEVPKVPERQPGRDEDNLNREPEPDRAGSAANGLDRQHEPSQRRYGANEPVRDVREHKAAILSPSLGGWHALGGQLDLPIDEKEPIDADRSHDPEAA
jgi:hypothetical protein